MPYKDPEMKKLKQKEWRSKNPNYHKEWRSKNPDYYKEWNLENPSYYKEWKLDNKDYYKEWRSKNPGYYKYVWKKYYQHSLDTGQAQARWAVKNAIIKGEILSLSKNTILCSCGKRAEVYDHRDYNKPLDVIAVCRSCNYLLGKAVYLNIGKKGR